MMHRIAVISALVAAGCGVGTDFIEESPALRVVPPALALSLGGDPGQVLGELYVSTPDGDIVIGATDLVYTSDNTAVATVDGTGAVTAVGPGQALIVGTYAGDASWTAEGLQSLVTVVGDSDEPAVVEIVDPVGGAASAPLALGTTLQLMTSVRTIDDREVSGATVAWSSSEPAVATVDDAGLVGAVSVGTTQVTASVDGIMSLPITVAVFDPAAAGRTGTFSGNSSYTVEGTVTLGFNALGDLEVEFGDDFRTSNGPDIDVLLSTGPNPTGSSINLGDVESTRGAQVYAVPDGVTLGQFDYVIIHCVAFNVPFGRARLN